MSVKVNPPPQLRIPDSFLTDPDIRSFFEQQQKIIFQLWNRTGGANDAIAGKQVVIIVGANTELNNTAYGALIVVEADSEPVEITLPKPTKDDIGEPIEFVVNDATFNTTIKGFGTDTIIGKSELAMNRQFQSYPLTAISTSEWIIAGD